MVSYREGHRTLIISPSLATSNALGEYRLFALQPGAYYVYTTSPLSTEPLLQDYAYPRTFAPATLDSATATLITIEGAQTTNGIDITVAPIRRATVSGRLIDASGKVIGVNVQIAAGASWKSILSLM